MPRGKRKPNSGASAQRSAGVAHFNAGRHEEAIACFRRAFALGDDGPEVRTFLAHALNSAGRPDEAVAEFSALRGAYPGSPGARKGLAPIIDPELLPRTERALRAALARDPRDAGARKSLVETLRLRAQGELARGDAAAAAKLVAQALALKPRGARERANVLEVLRACALAHQFAGRLAPAEKLFRSVLAWSPRDARACLSLASIMRARSARARERSWLARAVRLDRGALPLADRFRALMKLGRHRPALALAEKILDGGATVNDIRIFWDPWEWDDRRPRTERVKTLRALERALGAKARSPWLHYYRAELLGPAEGLAEFEKLAAFPRNRYGWMFAKAGLSAHCDARFDQAAAWFESALKSRPVDWRTRCFLAEAYLCLRRPDDAHAALADALREAPPEDKGQVLAWRGAVELWEGRYADALATLDEARALDAQCAYCWRGAALLKLGRREEALAELDETLRRFPRDFEAYVWRGEAKRELGLYREALKDLDEESYDDPKREPPIWLWALFNRALVKGALGDRAGLEADFDAIPAYVADYLRAKTGLSDKEALLKAGLDLGKGFRREEYRQAIWMT